MAATPEEVAQRLVDRDGSLFPPGNVARSRLGWLEVPREMEREARELRQWANTIDEEHVVLLGMGGSSLGPAVLDAVANELGGVSGRRIHVLDTTDPSTIAAAPIEDAFILVSSKSGTTLEPNVLFAHARTRQPDPRRYALITDPDTPLEGLGRALGVNRIFSNRKDIGGRYSVLSYFGIIPAVLAGYDIEELCGRAMATDHVAAVALGMEMAHAALQGEDKATIHTADALASIGLWVEQLIAESTGKLGRGIVPVPTTDHESGADRYPIELSLGAPHELGELFYRLELATAAAGHVLEIDPFDEPNVAESKANTLRVLSELPLATLEAEAPDTLWPYLAEQVRPGDYVSLQAYLPYGHEAALAELREKVRDRCEVAVTAGYGPRFLHSTGQLHKGGPPSVIAIQIVPRSPGPVLEIPDEPYDFGTLIRAQAIGDYESLQAHDRRVLRIEVDDLGELS